MPQRNYKELSPYDFECLVRDLLSADWGERLEVFAPGPDGGVDVRLLKSEEGKLVTVQCKHSPGKTWSDIRSSLEKEAAKVSNKKLGEYWLATSATLSIAAKDKAADLFSKQALQPERVLGSGDLDALLNLHPSVERSNYKLYLTSIAILELLLNPDLFTHARDLLVGIEERRKYYVQGRSLGDAFNVLEENRCCIVSGPPGVGKSTLAEMVVLKLLEEGYTPYWISEDVREVDRLWHSDEKQVFLYDDFLGQNALADKLGKNEDSRLLAVMRRVKSSSSHYLLMTTREYILSAARQTYEKLRDQAVDLSKITVDLSSYSAFNRAHILYNHVYFSELGDEARRSLLAERAYRKIIEHRNYNPRLIRLIVDSAVVAQGRACAGGFLDFAIGSLENPEKLWEHIFTRQLPVAAQDLLLTMLTLREDVILEDLRLAVRKYSKNVHGHFLTEDFKKSLEICDASFITVGLIGGKRVVRFANPGIRDYLLGYLVANSEVYDDLLAAAYWPEQALYLARLAIPPSGSLARASIYKREFLEQNRQNPIALIDCCFDKFGRRGSHWTRLHKPDGDIVLIHGSAHNEELAEKALMIAGLVGSSYAGEVAARITERLLPQWKEWVGDKQAALSLIQIARGLIPEGEHALWVSLAEEWFSETLDSTDDFQSLVTLQDEFLEGVGRQDFDLNDRFVSFAIDELNQLEYSNDVDEISYNLDLIESLAEGLCVGHRLANEIGRVSGHLAMLEDRENDERPPFYRRNRAGGGDGGDIDGLFRTLL